MNPPVLHDAAARSREIADLGPWFHNVHLPDGTQTRPDHPYGDFPSNKWRMLRAALPERLDRWTVLDVGCNSGFYSVELARLGARVVAIDSDAHFLRQARWLVRETGFADSIELREMQVYELADVAESYDLILFMGVFYHLRYPTLALDIVGSMVRQLLVFQTLTMPGDDVIEWAPDTDDIEDRAMFTRPGWPKLAFIEHTYVGDPTNWWAPNRAAVLAMLRSAGLRITAEPGHEIFLCEPVRSAGRLWPWETMEFRAATGRTEQRRAGAA